LLTAAAPASADPLGTTSLLSRASGNGSLAPGAINDASTSRDAVSGDGRYVAFISTADNLFGPIGDAGNHVYVRDTQTGTTELVDRPSDVGATPGTAVPGSTALTVAISGDGQKVAFTTDAALDPADDQGDFDVYVRSFQLPSDTTELVSRPDGTSTQSNDFVDEISVNTDGTRIAFTNQGNEIEPADDPDFVIDVFVRDTTLDTTTLVSRASTGAGGAKGDGGSSEPSIDGAGGKVAFTTEATNLADGDTTQTPDVHLRDTSAATTTLVSRAGTTPGDIGNGVSAHPAISSDGTHVAFASAATNLPNDPDAVADVFRRDLGAGTTTLISRADGTGVKGNAFAFAPAVNSDGSKVAFESGSDNLVPGVGGNQVYQREGTTTRLVSQAPDASPGDGDLFLPSSSSDGTVVTFTSQADNLSADDDNDFDQVFKRDISADATSLVSRPTGSAPVTGDGTNLARFGGAANDDQHRTVSDDGRFVAFMSDSDSIASEDNNAVTNVFVRDNRTDHTILVSRADGTAGAPANGNSASPSISADGRLVAFQSASPNLFSPSPSPAARIYVRDIVAGTTSAVDLIDGSTTARGNGTATDPSISLDGKRVAFTSTSSNLGDGDTDTGQDVHVRVLASNQTLLGSPAGGGSADGVSNNPALDGDGSRVAFESTATDLGDGDSNPTLDVHVRDLAAGQTHYASRNDGTGAYVTNGLGSRRPALSSDGTRVAFDSQASNLGEGDTSTNPSIYMRDLGADDISLLSVSSTGTSANGTNRFASISADGTKVAFSSSADTLSPDDTDFVTDVYVRDTTAGTNTLVSRSDGVSGAKATGSSTGVSISGNGLCVAFGSAATLTPFYSTNDFSQVYMRSVFGECPDESLPETTIASGPGGETTATTATFEFSSSEPTSTFRCSVDGAAFAACASPITTETLAPGPHTFEVFAVDPAGNADPTPASRSFTVTVPPGDPPPGDPPPAPDTVGPTMLFKNRSVTMSSSGVLSIALGCPAAEPARCRGRLTLKTVRRIRLRPAGKRKARIVTLGSKAFAIPPGKSRRVRIKPPARFRAYLRRVRKVSVNGSAVATDQAGNRKRTTRKLTIRAPKPNRKKSR
jgi:hypothetical protein